MQMKRTIALLFAVVLGNASALSAQSNDNWEVLGTFYLWGAQTDTTITTPAGTIESSLSFGDALENLDFAFMGTLEARYNNWSFIGDAAVTDLSFSKPTPGPAFGGLNADVQTRVLNAYALYRVYETPEMSVEIGGGARWFDVESTLTLLPGALAGRSSVVAEDWIDPVLATRFRFQLAENWTGTVFLDYGGFRSDSTSWQALLTAQYAINDKWSLIGGYRYLDINHEFGTTSFDFSQSGPVFGATYRF